MIASGAFRAHRDINATPMLTCEGKCGVATAHEFSHLELRFEFEAQAPPSLHLIYRCDTCVKPRRWGLITWEAAVLVDPALLI